MKQLNPYQRNRITKWALYGLILLIGFITADLTIIYFRDRFLPNQAPPKKESKAQNFDRIDRIQYSIITSRNIFSSSGLIPDPLKSDIKQEVKRDDPVPSNLPITLLGTLVHTDPNKSVAAVEVKSKSISGSYMVGAEIEGMATVEAIQRGILFVRNINTGALEYIEMNQGNGKVNFGQSKPTLAAAPIAPAGKEIQSIGNNTFRIKKSDLNKYLNDLSSLLMQARALPNKDPNTGEVNGYRLVDYQPGSIFEQLGLPRGTLITKAGGEPVTSVQAAMEMFNKMKNNPNVQLDVEINGSKQQFKYEFQ